MQELIRSIYKNQRGYLLAITKIIGNDRYLFAEDILGDCILRLVEDLKDGTKTLQEVRYKDTNEE